MKNISMFTLALAVLFVLQSYIVGGEAELEDSITLRVGNPGIITLTSHQLRQMLQKADFEGHGFKKEESRSLLSAGKFPANSPSYMTNIFYYKEVNCSQSQVLQVLTEADKLLPGSMRPSGNSRAKVVREMKVFSAGDPMAMCKAGVEIHFKLIQGQTSKTMVSLRRFKRYPNPTVTAIIAVGETSSCDRVTVVIIVIKDETQK